MQIMATINVSGSTLEHQWQYLTSNSHSDGMARNVVVYNSIMGADGFNNWNTFKPTIEQFLKMSSGSLKNEVWVIRQSFSRGELDYKNPDDARIANELGRDLAEQWLLSKGTRRYFCVFTQADGKSHLLHNHILVSNVDMFGNALPKGISFQKVSDINDDVVINGLARYGKNATVQQELKAQKQENDDRSATNAIDNRSYGHYNNTDESQKNRDHMTNALKHALKTATSRAEFNQYLVRQDIRINRQSNENDDGWLRQDGRLKKFLSLTYNNTHMRTSTALHLTLEQIDDQLRDNARVPVSKPDTTNAVAKTLKTEKQVPKTEKTKLKSKSKSTDIDLENDSRTSTTVTDWESPAQIRAKIWELKQAQEKLLTKRLNLQRNNRIAEANAITVQIDKMDVELTVLGGQLAELKSRSMVKSTEIARNKIKKAEITYRNPGDH